MVITIDVTVRYKVSLFLIIALLFFCVKFLSCRNVDLRENQRKKQNEARDSVFEADERSADEGDY